MKRLALALFVLLGVCSTGHAQIVTTSLSGTFSYPSGAPVNGQLAVKLEKSNILNKCVTPAKAVPTALAIFKVLNGSLQGSPALIPTDCMSTFQPYLVTLTDTSHNQLSSVHWYVTQPGGASIGGNGPVVDTFNRANSGTLGSNWTVITGTWNIAGNLASQTGNSPPSDVYWTGLGTFTDNQYAQVTVGAGSNSTMGVLLETHGGCCGYLCQFNVGGNNGSIYKGGGFTLLVSFTLSGGFSVGDVLYCQVVGGVLSASRNGVVIAGSSYTDVSPLTGGTPGMYDGATNKFDNWIGGAVSSAAGNAWAYPSGLTLSSFNLPTVFTIVFPSGMSSGSQATGSISGGSITVVPVKWSPNTFTNTTYTAVCTVVDGTSPGSPVLYVSGLSAITTTGLSVSVTNTSSSSDSGTVYCRGHI